MKLKRIISTVAAAAALMTSAAGLSGCSLGNRAPAEIDNEALLQIEDPETYKYDETVTIRIPVYDRGQSGLPAVTDNYWTHLVQKEMLELHNINVEFVSIPRASEVTKFNQMMAGKVSKQPDIIFHYDYPQIINYAKEGAFQTLDNEVIEHFAPDYYEATKDLDQYTYVNGDKVFLAATRPLAYNFITVIRADWVQKTIDAGLVPAECAVPENQAEWKITQEQYLQILKAFKQLNLGGSDTIPLGMSLPNANFSNHSYRDYPLSAKDWALYADLSVASLTWGPTKETLKYDNMLKNAGLISGEWYLDTDGSTSKQNFISGKQGVYGFYLTKSNDVLGPLKEFNPDAEVAIIPQVITDGVLKGGRADNPFGMMAGINVHTQHPEAVLMYYEWLYDNLELMQYGYEGENFNYQTMDDGSKIRVIDDEYLGEKRFNYNSNKDMWCLVTEGRVGETPQEDENIAVYTYAPKGYEYLIKASFDRAQGYSHLNYIDFLFDRSIDSLSDKSATLLEDFRKFATELINCDPDQFDELYEKDCQQYLSDGYQEILDEKTAAYDDMKANGNLPDPLPEGIKPDEGDTTTKTTTAAPAAENAASATAAAAQ